MRLRSSLLGLVLLSTLAGGAFAAPPSPEPGADVYAARRARLIAQLPKGALAIMNAAPEAGEHGVYRPESSFWYLTGMPESDTVALLVPDAPEGKRYTLYSQAKSWDTERWTGYRTGQEAAKTQYRADAAFASDEFPKQMMELMRDASSLWLLDGGDTRFRERVTSAWNRRAAESPVALPLYDLTPAIANMRLFKDASEVALLRQAAAMSVQAHLAALPLAQGGTGEWMVRAAMVNVCAAGSSPRMAYPSIVGSGANSVVLHYDAANQVMRQGDMVVNDSACEYGMYAADVTRSYPVGGVFSAEQRAIYEIVQKAQAAGQAKAVPGAQLHEVHDVTVDVIVDGLLRLGIMKGDKADIIAKRSYQAFYPHGSSHWIGLDVHDAGYYDRGRAPKDTPAKQRGNFSKSQIRLQPGMAFTIEPGIYIAAKAEGVDPKWWNIGVRIEDDFLVTEQGVECLSCALPRDIPAIEKLIRKL